MDVHQSFVIGYQIAMLGSLSCASVRCGTCEAASSQVVLHRRGSMTKNDGINAQQQPICRILTFFSSFL